VKGSFTQKTQDTIINLYLALLRHQMMCTIWGTIEGRKSDWQSIQKKGTKHENAKRFKDI